MITYEVVQCELVNFQIQGSLWHSSFPGDRAGLNGMQGFDGSESIPLGDPQSVPTCLTGPFTPRGPRQWARGTTALLRAVVFPRRRRGPCKQMVMSREVEELPSLHAELLGTSRPHSDSSRSGEGSSEVSWRTEEMPPGER